MSEDQAPPAAERDFYAKPRPHAKSKTMPLTWKSTSSVRRKFRKADGCKAPRWGQTVVSVVPVLI